MLLTPMAYAQEVTIGTQVWMTKNLNVDKFRNGDPIPEAQTQEEWLKAKKNHQPAWCYADNDPANGKKYGKLYNWYAVNDSRGLAPLGWHIPSEDEWKTLRDYTGGGLNDDKKLKSGEIFTNIIIELGGYNSTKWVPCSNCSYWSQKQKDNNPCSLCKNKGGKIINGKYIPKTKKVVKENIGWNGDNSTGFSALPGGKRELEVPGRNHFEKVGSEGFWWISDYYKFDEDKAKYCTLYSSIGYDAFNFNISDDYKHKGMSVRCLRDDGLESDIEKAKVAKDFIKKWSKENLNVSIFRNGDVIPEAKTKDEWEKALLNKKSVWCYYNFDPKNGSKFGKLYNFYAIKDVRGLAPSGWHIPSDNEWSELRKYYNGNDLKSLDGWSYSKGITNLSGFSALPGGKLWTIVNPGPELHTFFDFLETYIFWWSSSSTSERNSYFYLYIGDGDAHQENNESKNAIGGRWEYGLYVRCVKD
jgi:uncharacterized protein (TIGR02145 family)